MVKISKVVNRIVAAIQLGGVRYCLFILMDKIFHKEKAVWYLYKKSESMSENEIPHKIELFYCFKTGNRMDINHPVTFNEKIQWMKAFDSTPLKTQLADKYLVRDYVKEKIGEEYLIPLLGVWDRFDDIDFDKLPNSFVLKTNHGSGWNMVVKNKNNLDKELAREKFNKWMKINFAYFVGFEMHYKDIVPKIIAEEYISEDSDMELADYNMHCVDGTTIEGRSSRREESEINHLYDYKIHCFNGVPKFIQFIGDRNLAQHSAFQNNYDMNWKKLDWVFEDYPAFKESSEPPKRLRDMAKVAEKLSAGIEYVRVDLYEIDGKIYFGEMTLTPNSGLYKYKGTFSREKDEELGRWISIS